jgi:hypothetical protein
MGLTRPLLMSYVATVEHFALIEDALAGYLEEAAQIAGRPAAL